MTGHRMDWQREARTGTTEAVFCSGKSDDQIVKILEEARKERARNVDQSIEDRALHHSLVVAEEYKSEPGKVRDAQASKAEKDEAQAQMTRIVARLHKHLSDARAETARLTLN